MIAIMRTVPWPEGGVNKSGRPRTASQYAASEPAQDEAGNVTIASWSFDRADAFTAFSSVSEADLIAQASDEPTAWGTSLGDAPDPLPAVEPLELLQSLRREKAEREAKVAEGAAERLEREARDAERAAKRKAEQDRLDALTPEQREEEELLAELAEEESRAAEAAAKEAARQERLERARVIKAGRRSA